MLLAISVQPLTKRLWNKAKCRLSGRFVRSSLVRFASTVGIEISSVDEVAAGVAESVVNFAGFAFDGAPAVFFSQNHGAKRCFRNSKTAVAQEPISHGGSFLDSEKIFGDPRCCTVPLDYIGGHEGVVSFLMATRKP